MPRIAEGNGGFLRFVRPDQEFGVVAENNLYPFIPRNIQRPALPRQAEPYSPASVFAQRAVFPDKDLFDILPGVLPEMQAHREKAHVNTVVPDLRVQADDPEKKGDQQRQDGRRQEFFMEQLRMGGMVKKLKKKKTIHHQQEQPDPDLPEPLLFGKQNCIVLICHGFNQFSGLFNRVFIKFKE